MNVDNPGHILVRGEVDIFHPSLDSTEKWIKLLRQIDRFEIVLAQLNKLSSHQVLRGKETVYAIQRTFADGSKRRTFEIDPGADAKLITIMAGNPRVIGVLRDTLAQLARTPDRFEVVAPEFADRIRAAREIGVLPVVSHLSAYELRGRLLETDDARDLLQQIPMADTVFCNWATGECDIVTGHKAYQRSLRRDDDINMLIIAVHNNQQVRILHTFCKGLGRHKPRSARGWTYRAEELANALNAVRDLVEPHQVRPGTKRIAHDGSITR